MIAHSALVERALNRLRCAAPADTNHVYVPNDVLVDDVHLVLGHVQALTARIAELEKGRAEASALLKALDAPVPYMLRLQDRAEAALAALQAADAARPGEKKLADVLLSIRDLTLECIRHGGLRHGLCVGFCDACESKLAAILTEAPGDATGGVEKET